MLDNGEICDELRAIAESIGEWGNKLLEEDVFPREDYGELLELTLVYLGVVVYPFKISKTRCVLRKIMNKMMCCFINYCSLILFALLF
jgi:hypothetical protein